MYEKYQNKRAKRWRGDWVSGNTLSSLKNLSYYDDTLRSSILRVYPPLHPSVTVYRGLLSETPLEFIDGRQGMEDTRLSSWTLDPYVAFAYASEPTVRTKRGQYGYVIERRITEADVFADLSGTFVEFNLFSRNRFYMRSRFMDRLPISEKLAELRYMQNDIETSPDGSIYVPLNILMYGQLYSEIVVLPGKYEGKIVFSRSKHLAPEFPLQEEVASGKIRIIKLKGINI